MDEREREQWIEEQVAELTPTLDETFVRQLILDAMSFANRRREEQIKEMAELYRRTGQYERAAALFALLEEWAGPLRQPKE
jgi:hypothetical protein